MYINGEILSDGQSLVRPVSIFANQQELAGIVCLASFPFASVTFALRQDYDVVHGFHSLTVKQNVTKS